MYDLLNEINNGAIKIMDFEFIMPEKTFQVRQNGNKSQMVKTNFGNKKKTWKILEW